MRDGAHGEDRAARTPTTQNTVGLRGRVSAMPEERELPSGDVIVTFRVVVERSRSPMTTRSRQTSDWVDCVAWGARSRRTVANWQVGDVVEVHGALRRRFFKGAAPAASRVEVEVLGGRRLHRSR